ncbi:MAG: 3-methyl-2-oxobutanoate hydroxymethyltransferase [Fimbriimonadaceae bacterium]|nr:3-methyl-2-oxobutanoate hydroxymethyltransferase [Fimbriimonadaceae bacterium]
MKKTAPLIRNMKASGEKVVCVTAYDLPTGLAAERAGVDLVLVGDSLGNVVLGLDSTLPVTLEDMARHTAAVRRAVRTPMLVSDMPFGTYEGDPSAALASAVTLMRAGAEGIKLEGVHEAAIRTIARAGIPVMGHLGFTPQHVHEFGGHRVQGREDGARVVEEALRLASLGVFAIVLELIPATLAEEVTRQVACPTIGIGAGPGCDGQIQVFHDLVGLADKQYRHARRYAECGEAFQRALEGYRDDVKQGGFPTEDHGF